MNEVERKARNNYTCDQCSHEIPKGTIYRYGTDRSPRYDANDNQIGITYNKWKIHSDYKVCNTNNGFKENEDGTWSEVKQVNK